MDLTNLSLEQVEGELLSRSFHKFVMASWHLIEPAKQFVDNWHLKAMCDHMQAVEERKIKKLVINIPPRTGKSSIVSILYPAWLWTRNPSKRVLLASYSHSLSEQMSRKRRDFVLRSDWYRQRWGYLFEFSDTQARKSEYENSKTGAMISTSVGGTVTGRGGDILLLDDPLDPEQAASDIERQNAEDWLRATWSSRKNDPETPEILVMQRLHERDPSGVYLEQKDWVHLKFPMEFDPSEVAPKTPLGFVDPRSVKGELLDPVRFPPSLIDEMKRNMGSYVWAGQYQQEPAPAEGGLVKKQWIRHWIPTNGRMKITLKDDVVYELDEFDHIRFITVDPAVTEKQIGEKKQHDPDYTAIGVWCVFQSHLGPCVLLLDLFRDRVDGPSIVPILQDLNKRWKPAVIGIETIAFQLNLFQEARRHGLPVREISNKKDALYFMDRDKIGRVIAATPLMEDGRFFIPRNASWRQEYLKELLFFPNAAHDDCVDITAFAVAMAQKNLRPRSFYTAEAAGIANKTRNRHNRYDVWDIVDDDNPYSEYRKMRPRGDGRTR